MPPFQSSCRTIWLIIGIVVGSVMTSVWPHEPLQAASSDRSDDVEIITANLFGQIDAVLVVNVRTGALTDASMSRQCMYTTLYHYEFAKDFIVESGSKPEYVVTTGGVDASARGPAGMQMGKDAVHIADVRSGKVISYGIPYVLSRGVFQPFELVRLDKFSFRMESATE